MSRLKHEYCLVFSERALLLEPAKIHELEGWAGRGKYRNGVLRMNFTLMYEYTNVMNCYMILLIQQLLPVEVNLDSLNEKFPMSHKPQFATTF